MNCDYICRMTVDNYLIVMNMIYLVVFLLPSDDRLFAYLGNIFAYLYLGRSI